MQIDRKAESSEAVPSAFLSPAPQKPRHIWRIVGGIASAILFTVAIVVLYSILRDLDMEELRAELGKLSLNQLALASLFTLASYAMLTGYDALALRQIGAKGIGYPTTALASFTSYAVSFTLGFPLLTAGAVRLWVYGAKGLSAPKIASLTIIAGITFWLGMGLVLGFCLTTRPEAVSRLNHLSASLNFMIGAAILVAAIAYVAFIAVKPRRLIVQGWKFQLPGWRVTLGQVVLGVADVCASGGILYVLLPDQGRSCFRHLHRGLCLRTYPGPCQPRAGRGWRLRDDAAAGPIQHRTKPADRGHSSLPGVLLSHSVRLRARTARLARNP